MSLEEYWDCTMLALSHPDGEGPNLIVDDGGDATLLIHKGYELEHGSDWVNSPSSNHEEQCIKDILKKNHSDSRTSGPGWSKTATGYRKRQQQAYTDSTRWLKTAPFFSPR